MRFRLGRILLSGGTAIGVLGVVAVSMDLHTLMPAFMLKVGLIKLVLVSALALMGAGAVIERSSRDRALGGTGGSGALQDPANQQVEANESADAINVRELRGDRTS